MLFLLLFFQMALQAQSYREPYRPQFHFTPSKNWMNDPNGLVYFDGEYHLFYQYNPFGNKWGHMHWGHAVSRDLFRWKHLPIALAEEDSVMIFSGSAAVDTRNSTGFGLEGQIPLVAVYTAHIISDSVKPDDYRQEQHLAYSLDKGRTWKKYEGNPILNTGKKDFRDPKVFWHSESLRWVMAVVLPKEHLVQFYTSTNLKNWTHASDFGPAGDVQDIWECPDLLQIPVINQPGKTKWVLINSQQVTMQYFVGEFDGKSFTSENNITKVYRPDYGPDYYAGITFNNLPAGHAPILIGWANNWRYANDIPTSPWKSAMALPRELMLKKTGNKYTLIQKPAKEIRSLRSGTTEWLNLKVKGKRILPVKGQVFEMHITMGTSTISGVNLAVKNEKKVQVGYDPVKKELYIDRGDYADAGFSKAFSAMSRYSVPINPSKNEIKLQIFFDKSIIEVFANDGETVLTMQVFTEEENDGVELFSNGEGKFNLVKFSKLKSTW